MSRAALLILLLGGALLAGEPPVPPKPAGGATTPPTAKPDGKDGKDGKKPDPKDGGAKVKITTPGFRRDPNDGELFHFYGLIYVAGWIEFRDASEVLQPNFCYSRTPNDVAGTLVWRQPKPEMTFSFTCKRFIQRNGDQSKKVLGEYLVGNYSPLVNVEVTGMTPCEAPPPPVDPKTGKPGQKQPGSYAKLDAVLRVDAAELKFQPIARYELGYNRDNELTSIRFNLSATIKGSDLGMTGAMAGKDIVFRMWTACYNEEKILFESKKASLSEVPLKDTIPPPPPKPDKAKLGFIAQGVEFGDPPAAEAEKQQRFTQQYFTSIDLADRAKAVDLLADCKHPTTRTLLAQASYMERDHDLNLRIVRMLAAMPASEPSLAEMLASAFETAPNDRKGDYADVLATSAFRFAICGACAKWLQRAPCPELPPAQPLKPGQKPPEKSPQEIQRTIFLKVLAAFNQLAKADLQPGADFGRRIKTWWDQNGDGVYQLDIDLQRAKAQGR